ncbi:sigma-54-dependent transcriptional regulator [Microbulbifer agarilyticus]|uniref:sigma-54-dependent transcriptional regulator n=1 Tax=Microbulbifer agarilyticus TaxID=260552 RepID=UPI001CD61E00|nr:sigma-54 dependent transcriptional regulator [Microbulbifer agarilyticus]MCA0902196.1 sigma-54 dependent transcriptional regulator [Microbulbifer agarilyticus]
MTDRQPIALVVDDEPDICDLISMTLQRMHVRADIAMSVAEARRRLQEKQYDFCLTDMRLPDGDGLELVEAIQNLPADRTLPVAVITAHGNMDTAIAALKLGAFDFVSKPVNLARLRTLVQMALRLGEDRFLQKQEFPALLQGQSQAIQALRNRIEKVARSNAPVHLFGEAGAGKELTARCIHQLGPRANKAFITVHCSSIPAEQFERVLFGSKDGNDDSEGLLAAANGGTVFFDEIAELPKEIQGKLIQVIEEKRLPACAHESPVALDVRIISSTRKLLSNHTRSGDFRSDLYFRLNVIELVVPPLRDRAEDIPLLTRFLLRRLNANQVSGTPRASQEALHFLLSYPFPGNLRELENILERALTLCESSTIRPQDLDLGGGTQVLATPSPANSSNRERDKRGSSAHAINEQAAHPGQFSAADYDTLDDFLGTIERDAIELALSQTRWNKTAAAAKLGISFRSLRYRLKKLGLENE